MFSHTYDVLLDGDPLRLVHSINVTFDDEDIMECSSGPDGYVAARFDLQQPAAHQEANGAQGSFQDDLSDEHSPSDEQHQNPNPLFADAQQPYVHIEPLQVGQNGQEEYFDAEDPHVQEWHLGGDQWGDLADRPRPLYHGMCSVQATINGMTEGKFQQVCLMMAHQATKDMDWKEALAGPDAEEVIAAYHV
jgi:hypothetical protein